MHQTAEQDHLFGTIAIQKELISKESLDRALVIQKHVFTRTHISAPIGKVLHEMGLLTDDQVQTIWSDLEGELKHASAKSLEAPGTESRIHLCDEFDLSIANDNLSAAIIPTGSNRCNNEIEQIRQLLFQNGLSYGLISDEQLSDYLQQALPTDEPFTVARGKPPVPGQPSEIRYHIDRDPMRIGTLKEDGTMDWKDRGEIPQVIEGAVLAEKVGGFPGTPGIDIFGEPIPPPKIKEPILKCGKGAEKSEDGRRIVAKFNGTPKLESTGRLAVYSILPIAGDIGPETGHVEFDGFIDITGAVTNGYKVKGSSVTAGEIQEAEIDVTNDLIARRGIYGAMIKVGGNIKASHIHNSTIEVGGNLVVEKEIFNCTIAAKGQVLVVGGKILASKIGAKKGIFANDIGTSVARASELRVGVDVQHEHEMKELHESLVDLRAQKIDIEKHILHQKERIDALAVQLGEVAQEQDRAMVLKRRTQEQLERLDGHKSADQIEADKVTIIELTKKYNQCDRIVSSLMEQDDQARGVLSGLVQKHKSIKEQISTITQDINAREEGAKLDPGVPVVRVAGTIYAKTRIAGPYKHTVIAEDMHRVKISESRDEDHQLIMKIAPF